MTLPVSLQLDVTVSVSAVAVEVAVDSAESLAVVDEVSSEPWASSASALCCLSGLSLVVDDRDIKIATSCR